MLIGEPYWRKEVPDRETAQGCHGDEGDFLVLPELIERFGDLGYDVVEMVLADQDKLGPVPGRAVAQPPPLARRAPR